MMNVSIRAPRPHAGRPPVFSHLHFPPLFQSAPRVRTRGDGGGGGVADVEPVFQSAPRVRTRGDRGSPFTLSRKEFLHQYREHSKFLRFGSR